MSDFPISAVLLTLRSAAAATLLVTPIAAAVSYVLARFAFPGKALVSAITSLPLVMPPTAVGFLLLRLLAVNGLLGGFLQDLGVDVLFTWKAVVTAYSVMALPLMVRTMRIAFEDVHPK
jgi:molybdate transport system permease protein